jgi:FtsH-binding integral membrane protein
MKAIKILGHPVILMSIFLLLIIEGEEFGGIYLIYLLFALPHAAAYALLALFGLILVTIGLARNRGASKPILYLVGITLMILSLVVFFSKGNKTATFHQAIPLLTFLLFALMVSCFVINAIKLLTNDQEVKNNFDLVI